MTKRAPSLRGRWRRLKLGLPTVLGLKPRGWFIPHRYAPLLPPPGAQPPYPAIERLFEQAAATFTGVLDAVDAHATALEGLKSLFEQSWFPSLDAAVAYALVRERKPRHIIEVGSGHSTRVLSRALGGLGEIVAVDPSPRADIIDLPGVRVVPSTLQAAPSNLFDEFGAGDALFIDSSHILMPGSDVDILLNRVLPSLPAGALVHIHDIFLPFDYPAIWGWRAYNEQQGVVPLLATGAYRPLFSSAWAERRLGDRLASSVVARLPRPADAMPASLWLETLMLARLRKWLFESGAEHLPERVRETIRRQQESSEILIGWAELVLVALLFVAYETTTMATGVVQEDYSFETEVFIAYGIFSVGRLVLAYRRVLPEWLLYFSVIADMALLMGLIYSFHYKYAQTAVFYLKAPTLFYVFLFIALRALRFEARFVIFAGLTAAAGWVALILYALGGRGGPPNPTTDFVEYMTSNAFLIQAEADKLLAILLTTAVLAIAISRARNLLIRSVSEGAAARDLSRFFDPGVANRIRSAAMSIKAGEGELRDVAILTVDLRGFTRLAAEMAPDNVMKLLQEYQGHVCPLIVGNGGSIDKFLGDGILASFGAVAPSTTAAADALRAADAVIAAADRWAGERRSAGLPPLSVGLAVASGRVVFGAVGDAERLEFTVIGDAVNFATKLEKHNKDEKTRALADARTYDLAERQGYVAPTLRERRADRPVGGVSEPVDLVVLAK